MKKVLSFVKKHPRLLAKCVAVVTFLCTLFMRPLNRLMPLLIDLKGLPKTFPPPPPEPLAPQLQKVFSPAPKAFHGVYNPSWIGASFKDLAKHPVMKTRLDLLAAKQEADAETARLAAEEAAKQAPLQFPTVLESPQEECICSHDSGAPPLVIHNDDYTAVLRNSVPDNKEF